MSTSMAERERAMDLQAKVAFLKQPQTYPDHPPRVETIETHMSWVFLTPQHAFKLKKPVRYDYLDFSTLAARKKNCEEEVRLNQRLAPGVYRGVVALTMDARGEARIDGQGEVVDWLVKMRRLSAELVRQFDEGAKLDKAIRANLAALGFIDLPKDA